MKGIGASAGIALGRVLVKSTRAKVERAYTDNPHDEIEKLFAAVEKSKKQLEVVIQAAREQVGDKEAEIFEAHKLMLEDPELVDSAAERIRRDRSKASWAVQETVNELLQMFDGIEDEYIKERAIDLKDVSARIIDNLLGAESFELSIIKELVIIVAEDLTPSDMTKVTRDMVLGIITEAGGVTSHTAIMSRVMGIPAIAAAEGLMKSISNGDFIAMDGSTGEYFINPEAEKIECYKHKIKAQQDDQRELLKYKGKKSATKDGCEISIGCNIGIVKDLQAAIDNDAEGIGLFRSEFLYMDRDSLPTEEEQFGAYKAAAEAMDGKSVIIRTLDIGGDKQIDYMNFPKEENPFLGYRAIRYCLDEREIFRTQLRAMLRASAYGNVKIMLPMISGIDELREARLELDKAKAELRAKTLTFDEDIQLGIMIETPSAAIISDKLAAEADFFSIGTNDLTQYTLAVDRMNTKISHLYTTYHPAVLRLIKLVIDNAKSAGIWVGMCGEAAQDEGLVPVFLSMGLDEFSVSPPMVLKARKQISSLNKTEMERHLETILCQPSAQSVQEYLKLIKV